MYRRATIVIALLFVATLAVSTGSVPAAASQDEIKKLERQVEELQKLLKERDAQIAQLQQRLKEAESLLRQLQARTDEFLRELEKEQAKTKPKPDSPKYTFARGVIENVERKKLSKGDGQVQVSVGSDSGVKKGQGFDFYRLKPKLEYTGYVIIDEVSNTSATGRAFSEQGGPNFRVGDVAVNKLSGATVKEGSPANPPPKPVKGNLTAIYSGRTVLVEVSVGAKAGLSPGQSLELYRDRPDRVHLGTVWIIDTYDNTAIGRLAGVFIKKAPPKLEIGDNVADKLPPKIK